MLEFFRNIFKRLRSTIGQERYDYEYGRIINMLRRVTPLELADVEDIHAALRECVSSPELLDRKMGILKEALRNKPLIQNLNLSAKDMAAQIPGRHINNDRDVSYYINGKVVHGEVQSEEENLYFSKEHVESLNSIPLRPKKCDLDCVMNECKSCMEKRLRAEISRSLEAENRRPLGEKTKRRKKLSSVVTDLNEQLGVPKIFGITVADDCFDVEELDSSEREEFSRWKRNLEANARTARGLNLKNGHNNVDKAEVDSLCADSMPGEMPSKSSPIQPVTQLTSNSTAKPGPETSSAEVTMDGETHEKAEPSLVTNSTQDPEWKTHLPSVSVEPFRNPFSSTGLRVAEKPCAMTNPFSRMSDSSANANPSTNASLVQGSVPAQPSLTITNPFSATASKDPKIAPFPGIARGNGESEVPQMELFQSSNASPFPLPSPSGTSVQNAVFSNPFARTVPVGPVEPSGPERGSAPNPFVQNAFIDGSSSPFKQHSEGLQLANPFIQENPFSSRNIFQSSHGQDDPGLFASNDGGAGDGVRRKRAHRKR